MKPHATPDCLRPYAGVLFDLDGTLIDSTVAIVESTQQALAALEWPPVDASVIVAHIGYKLEVIFPERSFDERQQLLAAIGGYYDTSCVSGTRVHQGMDEVLQRLQEEGIATGLVTSKLGRHTHKILAGLGLEPWFDLVIASDDVSRMKPDPEGLNNALSQLNIDASACLYVGDTLVDVETARAAHMDVAGVAWGTDGLERLSAFGIDHPIRTAKDLLAAILPVG